MAFKQQITSSILYQSITPWKADGKELEKTKVKLQEKEV